MKPAGVFDTQDIYHGETAAADNSYDFHPDRRGRTPNQHLDEYGHTDNSKRTFQREAEPIGKAREDAEYWAEAPLNEKVCASGFGHGGSKLGFAECT